MKRVFECKNDERNEIESKSFRVNVRSASLDMCEMKILKSMFAYEAISVSNVFESIDSTDIDVTPSHVC